jgi:hypothetical protein
MAVMDAQALNTDAEGLAFLADVLGTQPPSAERRFPAEAWNPALRVTDRFRFSTVPPKAVAADLVPEHAD